MQGEKIFSTSRQVGNGAHSALGRSFTAGRTETGAQVFNEQKPVDFHLAGLYFGLVYFKILAPHLTTRTRYPAPVKHCRQSSSRSEVEAPPGPTARRGQAGGRALVTSVGLWPLLLGESLLQERGQQPVKLLHGHCGSAEGTADGKH